MAGPRLCTTKETYHSPGVRNVYGFWCQTWSDHHSLTIDQVIETWSDLRSQIPTTKWQNEMLLFLALFGLFLFVCLFDFFFFFWGGGWGGGGGWVGFLFFFFSNYPSYVWRTTRAINTFTRWALWLTLAIVIILPSAAFQIMFHFNTMFQYYWPVIYQVTHWYSPYLIQRCHKLNSNVLYSLHLTTNHWLPSLSTWLGSPFSESHQTHLRLVAEDSWWSYKGFHTLTGHSLYC